MENASKALLIAASVLIVILLIAFGMKIFNSTHGTADAMETTMQATDIVMFNNKFEGYEGKNKSFADVKSLIDLVIVSNATNSDSDILINYAGKRYGHNGHFASISDIYNHLPQNKKYDVYFTYYKGAATSRPTKIGYLHQVWLNAK